MNEDERYLFDLNGYLLLRGVLTPEEVAELNSGIDHHSEEMTAIDRSLAGESGALSGTSRRKDLGGMLAWERPYCEPFRRLLVHPGVKPYLDGILGTGYRLDHGPGLIAMDAGCEGGTLHGGGIERADISEVYFFKNNRIFTGLTVVEYAARRGPGRRRRGGYTGQPQGEPTVSRLDEGVGEVPRARARAQRPGRRRGDLYRDADARHAAVERRARTPRAALQV